MQGRIQKWGKNYAFRIPESFANELQWKNGTLVEATVQDCKLIIETVRVHEYNLEDLLKDMTPSDFQAEVVTGLPTGNEVW